MIIPELHTNTLGSYWVNLVDVTNDGGTPKQTILESKRFDTLKEANEFWATRMQEAMKEVRP